MKEFLSGENSDLIEVANQNKFKYQNADPFPSISFNNFFNNEFLNKILYEFPDLSLKDSIKFENQKEIKFAGKGELFFGNETKRFMHFLNSEPFLKFLQLLTGIKEPLIGDPYFIGGGQHEIKNGGLLKVHADFNKHPKLKLDRRINVLIYLNKNWKDENGGHFELWDKDMKTCVKRILPIFNTLTIFSTTDFSYHGHPDPLTCGLDESRKSLALYYYSNGRPQNEVQQNNKDHSTLFKERTNNKDDNKIFYKSHREKMKSFIKELVPPIIIKISKKIMN